MLRKMRGAIVPTLGILFLVAAIPAIWFIPKEQVESLQNVNSPKFDKRKERIAAETAARTVLVQAFGGLFVAATVVIGYRNLKATQRNIELTQRNVQATEAKQVAERFSKAVELLAHESIYANLGGIYALEKIAESEDGYYWQVMETLTAYVREKSPVHTALKQNSPLATDIQAVLIVLSRRKYSYKNGEEYRLDLSRTNLCHLQLPAGADLCGVNFEKADLREADLEEVRLEKARLWGTNLQKAELSGAKLREAELVGANLQEAFLSKADLQGAKLHVAKLKETQLWGAELQRAAFASAELQEANFSKANLQGASFLLANLQGAKLRDAFGLDDRQFEKAKNWEAASLPLEIKAKLLEKKSESSKLLEGESEPPQS